MAALFVLEVQPAESAFVLQVQATWAGSGAACGFLVEFQGVSTRDASLGMRHRFCKAMGQAVEEPVLIATRQPDMNPLLK